MVATSSSNNTAAAVPTSAPVAPAAAPAAVPASQDLVVETGNIFSSSVKQTSTLSEVHSRQIVLDAKLSATELALGKSFPFTTNLSSVFSDGVKNLTPGSDKVIITSIKLQSVYSDVPARVNVSCNLFSNKGQMEGLKNKAGWLYSQTSSELHGEQEHVNMTGEKNKFVQLASIMPFEQARHANIELYGPENNDLVQRHIADYGNISTKEELMNGIVEVTPEYYYVPSKSVVTAVISRNWDRFGFHPEQENLLEGSFYRVSKKIVDKVVDQLFTNVVNRLPFTGVSGLKVHLQSSNIQPSQSQQHNVSLQLKVDYRYPQPK